MIPLAVGLVGLVAVFRLKGTAVPGARAVPWLAVVAVLTLLQLWSGRNRIDPYRVTLLGYRFGATAQPEAPPLRVGGDRAVADLWVPGAGATAVAEIALGADARAVAATLTASEDVPAVVLVKPSEGRDWTVLGGVALPGGASVEVTSHGDAAGDGVVLLQPVHGGEAFEPAGGGVRLPWLTDDVIRVTWGGRVVDVPLPRPERRGLAALLPSRPSVFQRTYPLADVLESAGLEVDRVPPLGSFFYYAGGRLAVADLDSEVAVSGASAADPHSADLARTDAAGRRLMVAGLAHRDHTEEGLTEPERYGIRPLRTFSASVSGRWLDLTPSRTEVLALDGEWLDRVARTNRGAAGYQVRFSGSAGSMARDDLWFRSVPGSFRVVSHALFRLPLDPAAGEVAVVTPGGGTTWPTGSPFALGDDARALVLRVDGLAPGAGYWLLHMALFLIPLVVMASRVVPGTVLGLSVLASGFASIRLLLASSAYLGDPFLHEGSQLALWMIPVLPLAVLLAGDLAGRLTRGTDAEAPGPSPARALVRWRPEREAAGGVAAAPASRVGTGPGPRTILVQAAAAVALVAITVILFADAPGRRAILLAGVLVLVAAGALTAASPTPRSLPALRGMRWPSSGWALGAVLLAARIVMDLVGWREGIQLGATRVAVSAVYTPVLVVSFGVLVAGYGARLSAATSSEAYRAALVRAVVELGGFLALAVVGVSLWISDFGIALVGLPGLLLFLAVVGSRWQAPGALGARTVVAVALPLSLFVAVQAAPSALGPVVHGDARAGEARMAEWNRNELLLLERGDPEALGMIGQRRSEALAVMRETMRSYTRGNLLGRGYLRGRITGEIRPTAPREHTVSALLASQWGLPGTVGLVLLLAGLLVPGARTLESRTRTNAPGHGSWVLTATLSFPTLVALLLPSPWGLVALGIAAGAVLAWLMAPSRAEAREQAQVSPGAPFTGVATTVGALSLFVMAGAGLYMVLANYGLVFFTGKNVYLLGIDSVSDVVEGVALLALASASLSLRPRSSESTAAPAPAQLRPAGVRGVIEPRSVEEVGV